uniref:NADH-ubiquinone oxidoreductase chain 1 n=1 Tax=Stenodactylus petrii TaxID=401535 RepID=A0A0A1HAM7_9SAUR|nr:NADH dehydrogenase subunit 1 [Stenodactylus petrii]
MQLIDNLFSPLVLMVPVLLAVAFLSLMERKIISATNLRLGPNITGPQGILQPFADAIKLFIKEPIQPTIASPFLFTAMPALAMTLALLIWLPLPMPKPLLDINLGLLLLLAISSLTVYSTLWAGWSSNSKFALIGALRAVAQMISYEVTLGLILLSNLMLCGNYTTQALLQTQETTWLIFCSWPLAMMWFISTIAETNRAPFDLTEGETELVSGFNVEYAAGPFALFFLAEYANILMMNTLSCILFLAPNQNTKLFTLSLVTKIIMLTLFFLWVRASYPRFRYDQLMYLLWKTFLPLTLALCLTYTLIPLALAATPPPMT